MLFLDTGFHRYDGLGSNRPDPVLFYTGENFDTTRHRLKSTTDNPFPTIRALSFDLKRREGLFGCMVML